MVAIVNYFVPESMKLIDIIMILEREVISTFIASSEFAVVAVLAVKGLDKVTHVVDEETKGIGLGNVFIIAKLVHQVGVHVRGLVIISFFARHPRDNVFDASGQVSGALIEVIIGRLAFFEIRVVDEMEVGLPCLSMILEIVGKGSALYESVHIFMGAEVSVIVTQVVEQAVCSIQ